MTWNQWLAHNVKLNSEQWLERDQGAWQQRIHAEIRSKKKKPWIDRPEGKPRLPVKELLEEVEVA